MGKQPEVEELQKKHLEAIVQFVEQGHAGNIAGKKEAATACTTITLQTVVEVLEGQLKALRDTLLGINNYVDKKSRLYFEKFIRNEIALKESEINHYTNLLKQNK